MTNPQTHNLLFNFPTPRLTAPHHPVYYSSQGRDAHRVPLLEPNPWHHRQALTTPTDGYPQTGMSSLAADLLCLSHPDMQNLFPGWPGHWVLVFLCLQATAQR